MAAFECWTYVCWHDLARCLIFLFIELDWQESGMIGNYLFTADVIKTKLFSNEVKWQPFAIIVHLLKSPIIYFR